ncbi:hypothetical protein KA005_61355 [bacterium]|nr:hypothetical protein [bacterium]
MEYNELTNKQLYEKLSQCVVHKFLSGYSSLRGIEYGPLEINCFSICFWVDVPIHNGRRGVYVKIPKIILYKKENEKIMPLSDDDRELAEDEYRSLVHLSRYWHNDYIDVRFVKPLGFLKEYNAIITERFYAKHFFEIFRQFDLKRRFTKKGDSIHLVMSRLGMALSKFHQTSISECKFNIESILMKMESYCSQLKLFGLTPEFIDNIIFKLGTLHSLEIYTHHTNTLKGFDVRQVFIDKDGSVFILDPGKMKTDYKEMDLARFIVTCRILYWGSMLFFLRMSPDRSYEESFIQAYYGSNKRPDKVLCLLTIKELLKHWRMAYTVLGLKQWPSLIKEFLKKTYIDPFYKWQINAELANLER